MTTYLYQIENKLSVKETFGEKLSNCSITKWHKIRKNDIWLEKKWYKIRGGKKVEVWVEA